MRYHPYRHECLTAAFTVSGTAHGGEFDWGGRLPKSNGGARWWAQTGRKSVAECNGISLPDCETDKSSRDESRS
jgi:hypothetical protein